MSDFSYSTFVLIIALESIALCVGVAVLRHTKERVFLLGFCVAVSAYFVFYILLGHLPRETRLWLAPLLASETLPGPLILGFVSTALHGRLTKFARAVLLIPIVELIARYGLLAVGEGNLAVFVGIGQLTLFFIVGYAVVMLLQHRHAYLNSTADNRLRLAYAVISPALFGFVINIAWALSGLLSNSNTVPTTAFLGALTLLLALFWPLAYLFMGNQPFQRIDPQLSLPMTFSGERGLQNKEKATPTSRNIERWTALCDFMDKRQIYLEADLTLVRLAKEMGTNRAALSQLINTQTGGNFNQFINTYRVAHAQTL
ncbi:MAG: hypothetical protein AAF668_11955, partial [Pseudomonadota bacterium]